MHNLIAVVVCSILLFFGARDLYQGYVLNQFGQRTEGVVVDTSHAVGYRGLNGVRYHVQYAGQVAKVVLYSRRKYAVGATVPIIHTQGYVRLLHTQGWIRNTMAHSGGWAAWSIGGFILLWCLWALVAGVFRFIRGY